MEAEELDRGVVGRANIELGQVVVELVVAVGLEAVDLEGEEVVAPDLVAQRWHSALEEDRESC